MSTFNDLGAARAAACLAAAQALGVTVEFRHRGAQAVSLSARLLALELEAAQEGGVLTERRRLTLELPVQTGFSAGSGQAEPVTPGDSLTFGGRTYYVVAPVSADPAGQVWRLTAVERRRLASGV